MTTLRAFLFALLLLPALAWSNPININTASADTLANLSGIGPVKARAIIEYRDRLGGFKQLDELTQVKGIGSKTLDKLRDKLTVKSQ